MYQWILPSLSEILVNSQPGATECSSVKAEQQWRVSIAATEQLLLKSLATISPEISQGLVLSGPAPILSEPKLAQSLQRVTFTAKPFNPLALMPFGMAATMAVVDETAYQETILPLLEADPLTGEQFCLVFTENFRLVLVLAEYKNGNKTFCFSFDSEVVEQAWRALGARVMLSNPDLFADLEEIVQKYYPSQPDYRTVMEFSRLLLTHLPEPQEQVESVSPPPPISASPSPSPCHRSDVELLQAFAHEVRTPLTTIRTITRLLLKQRDLPSNVIKRLELIDRECTEQIDRMELLFRAAELETSASEKSTNAQLTAMSLDRVLQQSIPRWQQAADRRNLTLDVVLPQELPMVVSNPNMLDRVLTGLMENFTRSLPAGSHIQVQVIPAGDQLKLQLLPLPLMANNDKTSTSPCTPPIRKALGQLLMFQPETGTISLNLYATKHLFQAIGGKLIVRERPRHGEVLTIFLPLEVNGQQNPPRSPCQAMGVIN
ncbi:histidine kinase [Scytonema hofmannii PCC 7110]|uniref:histidine kinase n=1 Tax=Scytonema hofmannii PCC 7110 TaxID=128403 RepID=A0A139XEL6_9CYAN|nr:HAMP domain-containing sensor histidine kinase [Scytonema hofmannii]KYC43137.1 histidine kinase [Scytonema hofmannii PCC 7110]